jgi:predicted thioesterase
MQKIAILFIDTTPNLGYIGMERMCFIMEITVGMKAEVFSFVEKEDTAKEVGSGSLLVYATPCMVALMEGAACEAIEEAMGDDKTSVGTELNIQHISATPVGMDVRAEAVVTAVDGKVVTFEVHAYDESGEIGRGTHKRVIVPTQKFLEKAYNKL